LILNEPQANSRNTILSQGPQRAQGKQKKKYLEVTKKAFDLPAPPARE